MPRRAPPSATLRRMASGWSPRPAGGKAAEAMLRRRYSWAEPRKRETLVALGGDGFMLQTLHAMLEEAEAGRCSG